MLHFVVVVSVESNQNTQPKQKDLEAKFLKCGLPTLAQLHCWLNRLDFQYNDLSNRLYGSRLDTFAILVKNMLDKCCKLLLALPDSYRARVPMGNSPFFLPFCGIH